MSGEYAKKGRWEIVGINPATLPGVCDETMALDSIYKDVRMFSVDENSSSFFFFPALLATFGLSRGFFLSMIWKGKIQ
jgi:hypothetical protein